MYYTGNPEFEFGDGLSYDNWDATFHSGLEPVRGASGAVELTTDEGSKAQFNVDVENKGDYGGRCTIIAFWRPIAGPLMNKKDNGGVPVVPLRQKMFAFDGVRVNAGGKASLQFELSVEHFAVANEDGHQIVMDGKYEVFFKGAKGSDELLHVLVAVTGNARTVNKFGH